MDVHRIMGRGRVGRRLVGRGLVVLAGVLAVAAVTGRLYDRPGGPAVLAELDSPLLLGSLAALALVGAVLFTARRPGVRKAAGAALAAAGVLGALSLPLLLIGLDPFPSREFDVPAPDGAPRRLVVERTSSPVAPVWEVYVEQGGFPTARRWPVTRYRDDDLSKGVLQADWVSPDRIRLIDLDHARHEIALSPEGRPLDAMVW